MLASASPRRAALLRAAAFEFETRVVDIDERVRKDEVAVSYVSRLASEKSAAAIEQLNLENRERDDRKEELVVIAADTAVVVEGEILGKPRDDEHAGAMLRLLSSRRHDVMTGVSVRIGPNRTESSGNDRRVLHHADRARRGMVRRQLGGEGQGGRLRHPRVGVEVHFSNRGIVFERRRAALGLCL